MNESMIRKIKLNLLLISIVLLLCACQEEVTEVQVDTASQERIGEGTLRRTRKNADADVDKDADTDTNQNADIDTEDEIENAEVEQNNDEGSDTTKESGQQGEKVRGSRELLEYMFNYIYDEEDQADIVNLELHETEHELYYEWYFLRGEDRTPDFSPTRLELEAISPDGLWQEFTVYWEIWATWRDEEGVEHREFTKYEYGTFWLVNRDTKEVIPWRYYEVDFEKDFINPIYNEHYLDIKRYYRENYDGWIVTPYYMDEEDESRTYNSHRDFPYDTMKFVDDETYAFLKEAYDAIDFYGEFKTGDQKLYKRYIAKYKALVKNEVPFYNEEEGKNIYLSEYKLTGYAADYDPRRYEYYFFDMDGDNTPELCIRDTSHVTYVFKYDAVSDAMILWQEFLSHNEMLHGTRKIQWDWDGMRYGMYELDENGEVTFDVYFLIEAFWSNGNETYMLTVPYYNGKPIDIPDEMKAQAYFSEENGMYHFKVTEEQFDEITEDYFKAHKQSREAIEKCKYTYDDLFGSKP